jgi:hypothetical protein
MVRREVRAVRRRRVVTRPAWAFAVATFGLAVSACAFVFDFDGYETSIDPVASADAGDGAAPTADFDFTAPEAVRVEPGMTARLTVAVTRRGNLDTRIIVGAAEPLPAGVEPVVSFAIEPGASTGELTITASPGGAATPQTLRLAATGPAGGRQRDVALNLRGPPCALDRGFGDEGTGVVQLESAGADIRFGLAVVGDTITLALNSPEDTWLERFDARGSFRWGTGLGGTNGPFAVAADGTVFFSRPLELRRLLADGAEDPGFGEAGAAPLPCKEPVVLPSSVISTLCSDGFESWVNTRLDLSGRVIGHDDVPFAPGSEAVMSSASYAGTAVVACGHIVTTQTRRLALARWDESGGLDSTFGTGGRLLFGDRTEAIACVADDAGIVVAGSLGKSLALFSFRASGQTDPDFGDGGALPFGLGSEATVVVSSLALDDTGFLLFQKIVGGASLTRYTRNGQLDTSFAEAGRCALAPLGLGDTQAIARTPDRKLVIVTSGRDGTSLARIWL